MTVAGASTFRPPAPQSLALAFAANFIWINLSEVFRYFVLIMPMTREAMPMVPDVAPMSLVDFIVWGLWDTVLVAAATAIPWLALAVCGPSLRHAVLAGTGVWLTVFGLFWIGILNMNMTTVPIVLIALPLAWVEMVVAALIVRSRCFGRLAENP